jgi:hypothetical protein
MAVLRKAYDLHNHSSSGQIRDAEQVILALMPYNRPRGCWRQYARRRIVTVTEYP